MKQRVFARFLARMAETPICHRTAEDIAKSNYATLLEDMAELADEIDQTSWGGCPNDVAEEIASAIRGVIGTEYFILRALHLVEQEFTET